MSSVCFMRWSRCVALEAILQLGKWAHSPNCKYHIYLDITLNHKTIGVMWNKKPTRCHLVLYLFLSISPYRLLNIFWATLCPSSGADDLVVFFYLFISISPYRLLNMFWATLCPSSGADDLVVFHVWCSAVGV